MKNIILCITLVVVLVSCSSDDNKSASFDFPDWLIGIWDHSNPNAFLNSYEITSNNIILTDVNGDISNYKEQIQERNQVLIINDKTQDLYSYTIRNTIEIPGVDPDYTVVFKKLTDTTIELSVSTSLSGGQDFNKVQ